MLDTLVFYLAYRRLGHVAISQVLGRLVAVTFNYSMVRRAVFYSKLRHASVLPKYLLLFCLSGATSYAGIQLVTTHFHIQALPAKLLVETLLFFANFAIQRDFIFGKSKDEAAEDRGSRALIDLLPRWLMHAVLAAVFLALLAVVVHGFRGGSLSRDGGWTQIGRQRLLQYAWVYWAASGIVLATIPRALAAGATVLAVAAMTVAIGPAAVLAVAGLVVSSCALGSILIGRGKDSSAETQLCATLLGISIYIFLMTFMARMPVNYPAVYLVLLGIPVLIDVRGVEQRLAVWGRMLVGARPAHWQWGTALALLVFVLGIHLLVVPKPESGSDSLAAHLAIPLNISLHHILTFRPSRVLWSVMPMGADLCYSMVYLLGGEFAARLLNFTLLLLVEALLYRVARRWVSPAIAFLILALFASTSLVQLVTGSLMVENLLAAMLLGVVVAIWRFGETGQRRFLYTAAVVGGTALSIKLGGLAYVAAAIPLAAIEVSRHWRRNAKPVLACVIALGLLLAAALPAYVIAWRMTGNPVFPFLNQNFPSPLLDRTAVIADYRFTQPLTLHTPFDLTFHTDRYYEGRPGSLGFHYLLLVPLGLLGLVAVRSRLARGAALVALVGGAVVLVSLPNARYLYPSLPLLLVPLAALFGWLSSGVLRRVLITLAILCVVLNTWFLPSSNYYHGDFYEQSPLSAAMRQTYIHKCAPMREIGQYMNRVHPGAPVFLADGTDIAAFNAEVYTNGWHQYGVWTLLQTTRSPQDVLNIFDRWNVHYVAAPKPGSGIVIQPRTVQDLLKQCSTAEFETTQLYLVRLVDKCTDAVQPVREPLLVQAGIYDDDDPAIAYRGRWSQNPGFPKLTAIP